MRAARVRLHGGQLAWKRRVVFRSATPWPSFDWECDVEAERAACALHLRQGERVAALSREKVGALFGRAAGRRWWRAHDAFAGRGPKRSFSTSPSSPPRSASASTVLGSKASFKL